jgi:uncharacterized LabA/DUF88 family protein
MPNSLYVDNSNVWTEGMHVSAGDADLVPAVDKLRAWGFPVYVCFGDHASGELKRAASKFISLNAHFDHLRLT